MTDTTTTTADPAATTTTAAADLTATTTPAATTAPDWLSTLDPEAKTYVEAKGYKAPADVLTALKGYEPPASADLYEIPVPEGESPDFAKAVAPLFHKAGLAPTQAKALAEGWNAMQAEQRATAATAAENAAKEAEAIATRQAGELKREWGAQHDAKLEGARRAAQTFTPGADKDVFLSAMEARFGYDGMMRFWASIGEHMAEGKAHGMSGNGGPVFTPANFFDKSNMNP